MQAATHGYRPVILEVRTHAQDSQTASHGYRPVISQVRTRARDSQAASHGYRPVISQVRTRNPVFEFAEFSLYSLNSSTFLSTPSHPHDSISIPFFFSQIQTPFNLYHLMPYSSKHTLQEKLLSIAFLKRYL